MKLSEAMEFDPRRRVSKLLHDSERMRLVLFCLLPGQEVSPHTSPSEVAFFVVEGRGRIIVGEEEREAEEGTLEVCPPEVPHGLKAQEKLVVLATIAPELVQEEVRH